MSLDIEEVRRIAELAKLQLSPGEEAKFASQLSEIVDYIDQLRAFSAGAARADDAEPPPDDAANDVPAQGRPLLADFLDNAPASLDRFLLVPQVKAMPDRSERGRP